jgi:hypothetical protein
VIHEICSLTPGLSVRKKLDPSIPLPKIPGGKYYEEFLTLLSSLTSEDDAKRPDCDKVLTDPYITGHYRK